MVSGLRSFISLVLRVRTRSRSDGSTIAVRHRSAEMLRTEVHVHLADGQSHNFDLGCADYSVLIECKSYTFTASRNEPAAKLNHAKIDALLLRATAAKRKTIVFDDYHPGKGSLAELF